MSPDNLDLSRSEMGRGSSQTARKSLNMKLLNVILFARRFVNIALDKWVKKGGELDRDVVGDIMSELRRLRLTVHMEKPYSAEGQDRSRPLGMLSPSNFLNCHHFLLLGDGRV